MRNKLLNLLKGKGGLPPLPRILFNLEKLVKDPNSDIESVAALVETEPVLSGKLIKMANSAYFGGSMEKSRDIPEVVLRLGLQMILDLAYTLELPKMYDQLKGFDQIRFWKHSMAVAFLARSLARHLDHDEDVQKEIYMAGLMHDIGILVFLFLVPEEYKDCGKTFRKSDQSPEKLEQEQFGIAHTELGAEYLKQHWEVSENVILAVRTHHGKVARGKSQSMVTRVVSATNRLVNTLGIEQEFTTRETRISDNEFKEGFKLSSEELKSLIEETRQSVEHAEKVLRG